LKKFLVIMLTMVVFMFSIVSPATANGHKGEHVPVNVCHATNSDTNPYVFITVDDDSTKFQGHLAHRNDPNKTWKSDGTFNGTAHVAGDAKPDLIQSYTDSDGMFHQLDGNITEDSCINHEQPPADTPVTPVGFGTTPAECDVDGTLVIPNQPEGVNVTPAPGTYGPGTYNVTYTAEDGFVLTSDPSGSVTVEAATGDCPVNPVVVTPVLPSVTPPTCKTDGSLVIPTQPEGVVATYTFEDPAAPDDYTGPGNYAVVFTTLDGYTFADGTQTAYLVGVDKAGTNLNCGHKHHDHPGKPDNPQNPDKPSNPVVHKSVPTVVESGLDSVDSAQSSDDHTGLFVLIGMGILALGVGALRLKKN
jgi:hypothetical protein